MIERTEPIKITHNVIIGLCRRDLGLHRPPTAGEMVHWSKSGQGHGIIDLNIEQAQYLLDRPSAIFPSGSPASTWTTPNRGSGA